MVDIGDGTETSFWYGAWYNDDAFTERLLAIRSHCTRKTISVAQVNASSLDAPNLFVQPLSAQATSEFSQLQHNVSQTMLSDS